MIYTAVEIVAVLLAELFLISPIHEIGHLLAARHRGVRVEKFSLTFTLKPTKPYFKDPFVMPVAGTDQGDMAFISLFGILASAPVLITVILIFRSDPRIMGLAMYALGVEFFGASSDYARVARHYMKRRHGYVGICAMSVIGLYCIATPLLLF